MRRLFVSVLILSFAFTSDAQNKSTKEELNAAGTIQAQYDYLWNSSSKYQANKVIKMSILGQFNSNIQDSLKEAYQLVNASKGNFSSKENELQALQSAKNQVDTLYSEALAKENAFQFMGTETTKTSFRAMFFLITGALLILTLISFFRMRSKAGQASLDQSRYASLELEFEDYKKRSREKEQVLARQLQDEINKNL